MSHYAITCFKIQFLGSTSGSGLGSGSGSSSGSGSGLGFGSGSGLGSGSGSGLGSNSVLFPFGTAAGDVLFTGGLDASSDPQSKVDFAGVTCPFFGMSESILHVSVHLRQTMHITDLWGVRTPPSPQF